MKKCPPGVICIENFSMFFIVICLVIIVYLIYNNMNSQNIIVNNKTGFLADSFSHKDLGKKILSILNDQRIHRSMSRNARNNVLKKFSYHQVVKKYNDFYKKVIKEY